MTPASSMSRPIAPLSLSRAPLAALLITIINVAAVVGVSAGVGASSAKAADAPAVDPIHRELQTLRDRAEAAVEAVGDHPMRERANWLRHALSQNWLTSLKNVGRPVQIPAADRLAEIRSAIELIETGMDWPRPTPTNIPYAHVRPVIDGSLDDPAWATAATWRESFLYNHRSSQGGPATTWRITWDEHALYVAFECVDTNIVSKPRGRDGNLFFDDCVEVFLLPSKRNRVYWEIIVSPAGEVFDALHTKHLNQFGCDADLAATLHGLEVGVTIDGTLNQPDDVDRGYIVELAIPFSQLPEYSRATPAAGQTLHIMLARLNRDTDKGVHPDAYAFSPLIFWGHNIWNHMEITLVRQDE